MDGVILDYIPVIIDLYEEDYQLAIQLRKEDNIYPWQIQTWGFEELKLAPKGYIYDLFKSQRFFDRVKFFDGCLEFLKGLNYLNWEIEIVTNGHPINLALKDEFIKKHLPFCKLVGVNTNEYSDKSHIDMSGEHTYFIDDLAKNLIRSNCEKTIMFGVQKPWNEAWKGDWCYNYKELEEYFEERGLM
jgi:5'(3')-deoxyribonucleotidase